MADLTDIRRGLAALLRTVMPGDLGHVSPYLLDAPPQPCCLQVAGVERMERLDFNQGRDWTILIEGCFGRVSDQGAQRLLERVLADEAVDIAVESDNTGSGALFSRLREDGTVLNGQPAAADAVAFLEYRGQGPTTLDSGVRVLLGTWAVQVIT